MSAMTDEAAQRDITNLRVLIRQESERWAPIVRREARAAIERIASWADAQKAAPQAQPVEPACHGNGGCCPDDVCEKWERAAPVGPARAAQPVFFDALAGAEQFAAWFTKNYPAMTIISDPHWHAPRVFRAAIRAVNDTAVQPESASQAAAAQEHAA
jgi:hypothetical protein